MKPNFAPIHRLGRGQPNTRCMRGLARARAVAVLDDSVPIVVLVGDHGAHTPADDDSLAAVGSRRRGAAGLAYMSGDLATEPQKLSLLLGRDAPTVGQRHEPPVERCAAALGHVMKDQRVSVPRPGHRRRPKH
eukprot:scaffold45935_cov24-Tisochrysis_lutea.AAC.3